MASGPTASDAAPPGRSVPLDVLRGIAVVLVLGFHMDIYNRPWGLPRPALWAIAVWNRCGWMGVDLFFVLSGFLVSGLLFREYQRHGEIRVGRFFLRRGLKIYPSFYLFLATTVVMETLLGKLVWKRALVEALFLQNYQLSIWYHTWSLAVEEHFYLGLPLLLLALAWRRRGSRDPFTPLPAMVAVAAAVVLALRIERGMSLPYADPTHLWRTHLRLDALLLGVLLAYYWHFRRARVDRLARDRGALLAALGCLLVSPALLLDVRASLFMHTAGLSMVAIGFALLLLAALRMPPRELGAASSAAVASLAYVGANSYSIYLWHMPVISYGLSLLRDHVGPDRSYPACVLIYWTATLGVGVAMARVVEWPFLRFRDRRFPSRSDPLAPALEAASRPGRASATGAPTVEESAAT